jgi:hypothetical protein
MASEPRPAPALGALQELLYDLITAPTGVAAGLAARGLPADALDRLIAGDSRMGAAARLDIYANMYFFRILDVLREEFPRLAAALGGDAFHDLITDYLLHHRPAHPSLREVGARLPVFLRSHARAVERPWLTEMAALERAHRELFDAADADPLAMEALRALTPEAFSTLRVRLIPAQRVLSHAFAVSRSWDAAPAIEPPLQAETLLVWRRGVTVHHRVVSASEAAMLQRAASPITLADLCQGFADGRDASPAEDAALVAEAFQLLARWVDDALLTSP